MHPAVVESRFRERAERQRAWGAGLLTVAVLLWVYAVWQFFTPPHTYYCSSTCSVSFPRDWLKPVAALAVSTPVALVGLALFSHARLVLQVLGMRRELEEAGA
ncbi:hypothetical protein ACIQU5_16660 [Streptomyces sp. NPDC090306]|uniref:hypothetical protein n=1 Tax=unclassified Streptomyces TaxID=2593676 RepID=UPI0036EAAE76